MTKPKSKPKAATRSAARKTANPSLARDRHLHRPKSAAEPDTKHDRIIAMLRTPAGATIAAIMTATEWQQHSVRGFLAGVVRKKLGLNLVSEQTDKGRVYRIRDGKASSAAPTGRNRRPDAMQKKRRKVVPRPRPLLRTRSRICAVSISKDFDHDGRACLQRAAACSSAAAFVVCGHRLSDPGRSLWRYRPLRPGRCWIDRCRKRLARPCPPGWRASIRSGPN